MKTKIITGLKKEVLVIEAKSKDIACGFIFNKYGLKELLKWELLGKPDEISEEDLKDLVHSDLNEMTDEFFCRDYKSDWADNFDLLSALESFNSALESEIYWINPVSLERADHYRKAGNEFSYNGIMKCWNKAQEKTFDKKRTLIFVKD